jgi:hypothetical protein
VVGECDGTQPNRRADVVIHLVNARRDVLIILAPRLT